MQSSCAVLIAVYCNDKLEWFSKALESILKQTISDFKINIYLAIDGPLPNDIDEYINVNKGYFYKIKKNIHNIGLSKSLNGLIDMLEDEEFIFRMDSDDLSMPDRFYKQIEFLRRNPDVMVLGGALEEVDFELGITKNIRQYPLDSSAIRQSIYKASPFGHPTVCFRKEFFSTIRKYPEEFPGNEDIALWFLALKNDIKMANISEVLLKFRVSPSFFKRRGVVKSFNELKAYFAGIYLNYGICYYYIYPIFRFLLRISPHWLSHYLYKSSFRKRLLN